MPSHPITRKDYLGVKDHRSSEDKVRPAVERIVEDNCRDLTDAIFEKSESKQGALEERNICKEPEPPLKWPQIQEDQSTPSCNNSSSTMAGASFKKPKVEDGDVSDDCCPSVAQGMVASHQLSHVWRTAQTPPASSETNGGHKGKDSVSPKSLVLPENSARSQPAGSGRKRSVLRKSGPMPSSHSMHLRDRKRQPVTPRSTSKYKKSPPAVSSHHKVSPNKDDVRSGNGSLRDNSAKTLVADSSRAKVETFWVATSTRIIGTNEHPIQLSPCNGVGERELPKEDASGNNFCEVAENGKICSEEMDSQSAKSVESLHLSPDESSSRNKVIDITKGQEKIPVSTVNEVNSERPPFFHYIPQSTVFQNAYVNVSLARIGDDNSCSTCSGDCLSLSIPCACSYESGGEFVYTKEGLVKKEFLKECISMNHDPERHCHFYCTQCPLQRSKNRRSVKPCKGHLVRKFIKECWRKCGCDIQCGNRVVQRGITRRLQVFMTPGGKGWGLRTLEDLPKGAFVCEYVGEILTNAELFSRVSRASRSEVHSYPVLLDADWAAEGVLKDEEALCLDATYYGNIARFINHRCYDSNLVEIPVEIEIPDHHYYHLAFFTSRKVKAMEELTWDYGIDFDDKEHPVKAFECKCGSRHCRSVKRLTRSNSRG